MLYLTPVCKAPSQLVLRTLLRGVGAEDEEIMKRHRKCLAHSAAFALLLSIASTHAAHAYVDPGTGSYVIQIIIAALAGIAFAVKIYWGRIKGLFFKSSSEGQGTGSDEQ